MSWSTAHTLACLVIALSGFAIGGILLRTRRRLRDDAIAQDVFAAFGGMCLLCGLSRTVEMFVPCVASPWMAISDLLAALAWSATAAIMIRLKVALIRGSR